MIADDAVIATIYKSVTREEAFTPMLMALAHRFRCVSAALVYVDQARPSADISMGWGLFDEAAQLRYRSEYAHLDPAPAAMVALKAGTALSTDIAFADRMADFAPFLEGFYRPLGLAGALGGPVVTSNGRSGIAAVQRGPDRPAFSAEDVEQFERLMPHIAAALDLRRAFFEVANSIRDLSETIDAASAGLLVFDADGYLTHANRSSRRILDRSDGLWLDRSGRLRALSAASDQRLRTFFANDAAASMTALVRVECAGPRSAYALRLWTRPPQSKTKGGFSVLISDPDSGLGFIAPMLREVFGMREASAQLVAALASGQTLKAYAESRSLSQNTIKFHLRGAFEATGTHRQSDLVRVCTVIARDLGH